ncbi:SpoIVB peptidase [Alkaliphilus sp. B6464]|uniref:SpoIVB peptidase n=1 Tax=Alkaliphilus sp. B6464 TaxID=2731219 RepID=UPI001BA5A8D2|nr:SpoIVB peptidase [Alkaliphilus sp. B6464]QUH20706.1 SpoIVB peptidase [Alkaliphilus sp. B6464]
MKNYRKLKPISAISLSIFFIFFVCTLAFGIVRSIPSEYNIPVGDEYSLQTRFPLSFSMNSDDINSILEINQAKDISSTLLTKKSIFQLKTLKKGTADLQLKILGLIPYKTVKVNVVSKIQVVPGGESVGVKLNTDGVLVVGVSEITDDNGRSYNLASNSGIKIGDTLVAINDIKINNASHVSEIVKASKGKELNLTMKRDKREFKANISPVKAEQDGQYKLGLWVRDKTAGVGTLSFFHPISGKFGALGHAITDVDTGALLSVKDGEIIKSRVVSIEQGKRGKPGEIRGVFYETSNPVGKIEKNTQLGVYGELFADIAGINNKNTMPIAYQHEIQEGPAYILTTLDNNKIEKFDIEITKINFQTKPEGKSMVIKVTDKTLLEKTGGIVQGMSGSPIIQNGKVIGAVTHVLVNDPAKGYGIFIEWMISESGINDKN